jgi:alpha-L-fucosidase
MRFTTKGNTLYAILLAWPNQQAVIKSLSTSTGLTGRVKKVTLLGHTGSLRFTQDADGLKVEVPANQPCEHAFALKITGLKLKP